MEIKLTKHSQDKLNKLIKEGWQLSERDIKHVVNDPDFSEIEPLTKVIISLKTINEKLDLRVVHIKVGGIISVITFYPAKKGRYAKS